MMQFESALLADVEGLIAVLDLARQVWPDDPPALLRWLTNPQARWQLQTPLQMIAGHCADDVLDVLSQETVHG
jgi:hypothetical protein